MRIVLDVSEEAAGALKDFCDALPKEVVAVHTPDEEDRMYVSFSLLNIWRQVHDHQRRVREGRDAESA